MCSPLGFSLAWVVHLLGSMPRPNLILQFGNLLSVWGKILHVFFRIQDLHYGRTELIALSSPCPFIAFLRWLRKHQQINASVGWRGGWYDRRLVRDWGKGICQARRYMVVHQSHLRCHVLEGREGAGIRVPSSISGWFKTETKRGAAQQESRAAVSSHPAFLDIEAATSICQIPGIYCPFPSMNSACPTPELVFSSLDSVICLPLLQEIWFFIIIVLPLSAFFFFFLYQAVLNTFRLFLIYMIVLRGANGKQSHVMLVIFL